MKVLGLIPARGGSKGITDKNLRELSGKPLLAYTAEAAKSSGVIDRLILSTDSQAIADLGASLGIELPFLRPAELAQDDTAMLPVMQHAVGKLEEEGWKPDIIVLLQPTSPLRQPEHISEAVQRLQNEDCDSVVSVTEIPHLYAPQKSLRVEDGFLQFWLSDGERITSRQQLEPSYAQEGTVFVVWRDVLMEQGSIYGKKCLPLILPREESHNLDTLDDWRKAEIILGSQ